MGEENTICWNQGDPSLRNPLVLKKDTGWSYSIEMTDIDILEDITTVFLDQFAEKECYIKEYIDRNHLNAKFFFVVEILNKDSPSIFLNQKLIAFSSSIKAEIDIDLYII